MPSVPHITPWDVRRPPPAEGKTFLVTGGKAGIGYFVAEQLAGTGAAARLRAASWAATGSHPAAFSGSQS